MSGVLEGLGLEQVEIPFIVELANGVRLTGRTPTGLDWSRARAAAAATLDPADQLKAAVDRYSLTSKDSREVGQVKDLDGLSLFLNAVEVACLVIRQVERIADGRTFSIDPSPQVFATLFRMDSNLDAFVKAAVIAGGTLIQPKKGSPP